MIVGVAWKDVRSHTDKDKIVVKMKEAGFEWADDEELDPFDERKTRFIGDDMLILDVENKEMWTGDWGRYIDLEVDLNFVRFLGHKRFDTNE